MFEKIYNDTKNLILSYIGYDAQIENLVYVWFEAHNRVFKFYDHLIFLEFFLIFATKIWDSRVTMTTNSQI